MAGLRLRRATSVLLYGDGPRTAGPDKGRRGGDTRDLRGPFGVARPQKAPWTETGPPQETSGVPVRETHPRHSTGKEPRRPPAREGCGGVGVCRAPRGRGSGAMGTSSLFPRTGGSDVDLLNESCRLGPELRRPSSPPLPEAAAETARVCPVEGAGPGTVAVPTRAPCTRNGLDESVTRLGLPGSACLSDDRPWVGRNGHQPRDCMDVPRSQSPSVHAPSGPDSRPRMVSGSSGRTWSRWCRGEECASRSPGGKSTRRCWHINGPWTTLCPSPCLSQSWAGPSSGCRRSASRPGIAGRGHPRGPVLVEAPSRGRNPPPMRRPVLMASPLPSADT